MARAMVGYGDPARLRRLAEELARSAERTRLEGGQVREAAEAVGWQGLAADAMRELALQRAAALERVAQRLDQSAWLMRQHADRVELLQERIRTIMRRLAGWLDEIAAVIVLPPPGHMEWLQVPERLAAVLPQLPDQLDLRDLLR